MSDDERMDQHVTFSLSRGSWDQVFTARFPVRSFRLVALILVTSPKLDFLPLGVDLRFCHSGFERTFGEAEEFTNNGYVTTGS